MATAKPKTKRMMFGGMAKGPAKPPMRMQPQAAPMRTQSQMQAAAKAQQGARPVTPTPSMNKMYADFQAQKSGATGTGSQQTRTEPSLDDIRGAIKDTKSGKTIAGPMGSQLQSAANAILNRGTSVGSQRALPANPMQKSAQQKLDTTPPPGAIVVPMAKTYADFLAQESKNMGNGPQSANTISMPMQSIKSFGQPNSKLPQAISGDAATALGLGKKKGGAVKMAKGGAVKSSASRRGDGIAMRGKTRGKMC
jgi:hypothetical protein